MIGAMEYQYITTSVDDNVQIITINRPEKMNALNAQLLQEVKSAVEAGNSNDDVHGIIITGSEEKAFAAGADIAEFKNFSVAEGQKLSADGHEVMNTVERSPKLVIAAVNGFALGGGCELAMACHLRVASPNARFGQPEVNLGLIPGYGGTQRMVQLIGKGKAMELLTTADMVGAEEAKSLGLVNHVVEQNELISFATSIIQKVAKKSPRAIGETIACVNAFFDQDADGMRTEITKFGECFQTTDFVEGTSAFLEKRKTNFRK